MFIQCLIERSDNSDTFVDFEQVRYRFSKNEAGDCVCFVGSETHRRRLLSMGENSYAPYTPPVNMAGPIGATPEPMTPGVLKKKKNNQPPEPDQKPAEATQEAQPPRLVDYDWTLDEKVAKTKEFKFLTPDAFREFVDTNRQAVMKWPLDVRRELAKKLDKMMPEEDPDIEGFIIDDYLRSGSTGDS